MRRREKEIKDSADIAVILEQAKYITIAMCRDGEPYLVTLSHGYDRHHNCLYFHCAKQGKKIDYLKNNNRVWGQALLDKGYVQGACDHLYETVHFKGRVTFVEDIKQKRHALEVMIKALDDYPAKVIEEQLIEESIAKVNIGRIDIEDLSGKKSEKVFIML